MYMYVSTVYNVLTVYLLFTVYSGGIVFNENKQVKQDISRKS